MGILKSICAIIIASLIVFISTYCILCVVFPIQAYATYAKFLPENENKVAFYTELFLENKITDKNNINIHIYVDRCGETAENQRIVESDEESCKLKTDIFSNTVKLNCENLPRDSTITLRWKNYNEPINCSLLYTYQYSYFPIPLIGFTNELVGFNNAPPECEFSGKLYSCEMLESEISQFNLTNATYKVGEIANTTYSISDPKQKIYVINFTYVNPQGNIQCMWSNNSNQSGSWWTVCPLNFVGNWTALLIVDLQNEHLEKSLNFSVE